MISNNVVYVRPAKPQISLRIRAVWSKPLLVAWIFYVREASDQTHATAHMLVGWLVGFVALRLKSTAMVIAGRSVHLTTLSLGRLEQAVNQ